MLTQNLIEQFNNHFVVEFVRTDKQREDMYRLRHDVYVKEFKYEEETLYPDGLETDEYDDISVACIIYHIPTGRPAACVRLIPGRACTQFPVEKYTGQAMEAPVLKTLNQDRESLAEISRLAVSRYFRRRGQEALTPAGYTEVGEERTYPLLSVACFLSCIILSDVLKTEHHIASMEPFLPRLLHRQNLDFERIGGRVFYHGYRCSYLIHKTDVMNHLSQVNKDFVAQLHQDITGQLFNIF